MTYFKISNEHIPGWNVLVFPKSVDEVTVFPNTIIFDEMVNAPKPESIFRLLDLYKIEGEPKKKIKEMVNPTWKEVANLLVLQVQLSGGEGYINDLLVLVSPFAYGDYKPMTDESLDIFKRFSNGLVEQLYISNTPSKLINKVYHLSQEQPKLASRWVYCSMVVNYCQNILPCPVRPRMSRICEFKKFNQGIFTDRFIGDRNEKEVRKVLNLSNRLAIRFSTYLPVLKQLSEIEKIIDPTGEILLPIKQKQNEKYWKAIDEKGFGNKARRAGNTSREILCQCGYCWNFRIEETANSPKTKGFCTQPSCENANLARKKYLSFNKISAKLLDE